MPYPVSSSGRFGPFLFLMGLVVASGGIGSVAVGQATTPSKGRSPVVSRPSAPSTGPAPAATRPVAEGLGFASGLYRNRQYDLAAEEYERFLRAVKAGAAEATDAEVADAWFGLGNCRLFLHKYKEARQAFEGFVKAAPNHPNAPLARYRIGEAAYVLGDLAEARRSLEAYTGDGGGDRRFLPAAWTFLGDIATKSNDLPGARRSYENALSGDLKGALGSRARLGLGRVLAAQGESTPSLVVLRELIATGGPEWLDKAWLQVGEVEATLEHWPEAVEAFESLERSSPKSPLIAEGRLDRAEALNKLGRRAEAEALLRPLAADPQGPLSIAASDALGTTLLAENQPDEALTVLDAALARPGVAGSTATALRFHAAQAALALGKTGEARARFAAIATLDPKSSWADDAQLRAAALALDAKDYAEARQLAGSFIRAYPESPLGADAHLIDARAALGLNQPKDAITILTASLADDKPTPAVAQTASFYLGLAYQKDGQADKAAELLGQLASAPTANGPASADARFLIGQADFEAGRFAEAISALEKYLADKPGGDVAADALARITLSQAALGQFDAAEATLVKLSASFPQSPTLAPTRLRLAEVALQNKQFDRSVPLFRLETEAKTGDPAIKARAWAGLGWSLLGSNHPVEAAAALGSAIELAPDSPVALDALFAQGRAFEDAKQSAEAIAAYSKAIARQPDSAQAGPASLALARLQVEAKQPSEAAKTFATVVDKYAATSGEPVDAVLAEWGWALVDAGQSAEADAVFERLLKDQPDSPKADDARLNLAESAYAGHNLDRTLDLLKPLLAPGATAKPALVEPALYRVGRAEVDRRDWPAASKTLDRLLADFPTGPFHREARFWRAEVAFQAGDTKTAEADFTSLVAEPPGESDPKGMVSTARGRLVQALVQQNRWGDALAAADAWASGATDPKTDPIGPEVDYARGRAFQGLARFDEARDAFDRAIAARKGTELAARSVLMRGETFFHQEQYREALREFYRVVIQYNAPEWQAAALLEAGKVHEKLNQWREAAETYEKLQARFPQDRSAVEAGRRLEAARKRASGAGASPSPTG